MAVRQYGMVEVTWRQDFALDQTKVGSDVRVTRLGNEFRMSFGVHTGFVDPRVQGGDIDVMDLLVGGDMMVQFHGIGTTSAESVAGIQWFCEHQVCDKRTDVWGGVFEVSPFAFPHFHYSVPFCAKRLNLLLCGLVDILHGPIIVAHMLFVTVGIAAGTSMPETTVKFVHGVCSAIETVHMKVGAGDAILTGIAGMLNVVDSCWADQFSHSRATFE